MRHTPGPYSRTELEWDSLLGKYYCSIFAGSAPNPASKFSRPIRIGSLYLNDVDRRPFDKDTTDSLPIEANVNLLIAAPELLELLQKLAPLVNGISHTELVDQAYALINKVTGK